MCIDGQNNDYEFLTSLCAWRSVMEDLGIYEHCLASFQMAKIKVSNLHRPNSKGLDANQLHYDVWLRFLTRLKHMGERAEVKTNLHVVSQTKLREYRNEQIAHLEGFKYGYCNESPFDYKCEGLRRAPCCILRDIMHHEMTVTRFFYI